MELQIRNISEYARSLETQLIKKSIENSLLAKRLNDLHQELQPVINYFNTASKVNEVQPKKRISRKQQQALDIDAHMKALERAALAELIAEGL